MTRFGVGLLAAGPVAQAIHIPAVRRFPDSLELVYIMDIDDELATRVASQHGMKSTTNEDDLINDAAVDIVVVGSPNGHHARQVIKACKAGKKVVIAEKPLAVTSEELAEIDAAAKASGTKIIVGTMHAYDTAYLEALEAWKESGDEAVFIDVSCFIPPNDEFVDYATQLQKPLASPAAPSSQNQPSMAMQMSGLVLGLTMHDIPLIREFAPNHPDLKYVRHLAPWGNIFLGESAGVLLKITSQIPGTWAPNWTMTVVGRFSKMHIEFLPSYVLAGSCVVTLETNNSKRVFKNQVSGYESEWAEAIRLAAGNSSPIYDLKRIGDDFEYALSLVSQLQKLPEGN